MYLLRFSDRSDTPLLEIRLVQSLRRQTTLGAIGSCQRTVDYETL